MKSLRHHDVRVFEDGQDIVQDGDESREMFVIRQGVVEIFKKLDGREVRLALLERGSFFGEMSLLEGLPRSASARAVGRTTLLVLHPGSLLLQIRRDPTFAFELLQQMSSRIRSLNERLLASAHNGAPHPRRTRSLLIQSGTLEYAPIGQESRSERT